MILFVLILYLALLLWQFTSPFYYEQFTSPFYYDNLLVPFTLTLF